MKNQTLLLCLAVLTALVALPCIAQNPADQAAGAASKAKDAASQAAQQTSSAADDATTQAKVQQKLQRMSSELNLTDDQKTKLKPILQNEVGQLKTVRDDTSMSADAKQAKMKEIHSSAKQQINTILTPDQQQKLATMKSEKEKD
jgi:Spy/CpxP family protein refolding chaperone